MREEERRGEERRGRLWPEGPPTVWGVAGGRWRFQGSGWDEYVCGGWLLVQSPGNIHFTAYFFFHVLGRKKRGRVN